MDPHRRIYSGTGSSGMTNRRLQNTGRFSSSPMSSPQCNYPYALMLPQQQQKFNPVITPTAASFGYSQKPWAPTKFGQNSGGTTGAAGQDVRYVPLNWNDLLGQNQNSVGTSGTSQFVLGDHQIQKSLQTNSHGSQSQIHQPYAKQNYPSQAASNYGGNGNQFCQNPNCQNCGQSENESPPIKFQVSVGNHGDGLGAPTYTYTYPQQPQQSPETNPCPSGDTFQGQSCPTASPEENSVAPAAAIDSGDVQGAATTEMTTTMEAVVPQSDQKVEDPCGSCSACKFKSTKPIRRVGIPTKNNKLAPCPTPKAGIEKPKLPVISPSKRLSTVRKNPTPSFRLAANKSNPNNSSKTIGK